MLPWPPLVTMTLAYTVCVFGNVQITETLLLRARPTKEDHYSTIRMNTHVNILVYQIASCKHVK